MLPDYAILDICLVASELTLLLSRRAGEGSTNADRGSLRVLWIVITLAITAAHLLAMGGFGPYLHPYLWWKWIGVAVFVAGLLLRRWSIRHLGRFFTVGVSVARDHRVVDDGPYRLVRHPTYAGLLLEFLGLGLVLRSVPGLLVMMIPIFLALRYRMQIEEAALLEGLGAPYAAYQRRTKRLVPGLY